MTVAGQRSIWTVDRLTPTGAWLDGEDLGPVWLPLVELPEKVRMGDALEVMPRRGVNNEWVATTVLPRACVGEFASLNVVGFSPRIGAYLDWGNGEELLLPVPEAPTRVRVGSSMIVGVISQPGTGRVIATLRLETLLHRTPPPYVTGQRVRLLITAPTPLGYNAIVENAHWGLVYKSTVGSPLAVGMELDGYVRGVRPDGKIDLGLDASGYRRVPVLAETILDALRANGGKLAMGDHSSPAEIRARFGVSKKAFKQAIGALYRDRRIALGDGCIEWIEPPAEPPSSAYWARHDPEGQ